jgi:hypothetical protein
MGLRCEYEAPEVAEETWDDRPCVFDKRSGVRLQLTADEQAALEPLIARMSNGNTPFEVSIAFDLMAEALYKRRLGYCFEWDRLASRTATEWDTWLRERLRPLRWGVPNAVAITAL